MRSFGAKRPSCEECGKVELSLPELVVWNVVNRYFRYLVRADGWGGWQLDPKAVDTIAEELEVDSKMDLIDRMLIILEILMKQEEKTDGN